MSLLTIILLLIFVIIPLILFAYMMNISGGVWRLVKAAGLNINFTGFIFQFTEMTLRRIPAEQVFKLLISAKKAGAILSLSLLKDFYLLVDKSVELATLEFDKDIFQGEPQFRRISSFYLLSENIDKLLSLIYDSIKASAELKVKAKVNKISEARKRDTVNKLIKSYSVILANYLEKNPPVQKVTTDEKKKETPVKKVEPEQKKPSFFDEPFLKYYANELKTSLKGERIFFCVHEDLHLLKRLIFENSSNSLIKAQQSGLSISLKELEDYFGMNGDIENTVDILLKARHIGLDLELKDLGKFIITGGDIENTLIHLINARQAGLKIELSELEKYHLLGGNIETVIKALISAHHEGLNISIVQLSEYLSQGGDVDEIVNALIKLHQEKIDIPLNQLSEYKAAGGNVKQVVLSLIKAYQSGITIPMAKVKSFLALGGDVEKLINVMILSGRAELDVSFDDCEKLARIGADISIIFESLKIVKRADLTVTKEKLMDMQAAGGNMLAYVQTLEISDRLKLNINPEELEADLIEGRRVMDVINAIFHARKENVDLDYNKGIRYDRAGHDVPEVVKWAVYPQVIKIDPVSIITKDGIDMKLWINVMVRGRISQFLKGSREKVLAERVNDAVIKEVERFESYKNVLDSLNDISDRLFKRLTGKILKTEFPELEDYEIEQSNQKEEKLNAGSAFEILDINIPNLEMGKDAFAGIRKEMADLEKIIAKTESERRRSTALARELEAKAKLIEAEAELQRGMAFAFKEGLMDSKEYHKHKILNEKGLIINEGNSESEEH
ncbi:MAG: flotillin-like FloA family protein [Bacteroidales bacterium]